MALSTGTKLGPYEVVGSVGVGGMGEVYRARDGRLGREVAIKVLPASFNSDGMRLQRFEQEAHAAASLNHPNILAVYDVGRQGNGAPYIVSELLSGETLREQLRSGPLPLRKVIEYGQQIARGLAAAHNKGIVHRDLKPDNIFITDDRRVKILDFGLAKLTRPELLPDEQTLMGRVDSEPGTVLGSVGYMSPEQVRGKPVDSRSDLFALGAILYEMLSGKRAFQGESSAETMSAIVNHDPPELSEANHNVSPALGSLVEHCLEKNPEDRLQSAQDVAFALEAVSRTSSSAPIVRAAIWKRRGWFPALITTAILVGIVAFIVGRATLPRPAQPRFHRLTFRRGSLMYARFAPDGHTIVYSANWEGNPPESFSTKPEALGSTPLGISHADTLSVSPTGELLVVQNRRVLNYWATVGTLARVPMTGGTPRPILEDVQDADWAPDGSTFAVAHFAGNEFRLEYPAGKILYRTQGWIGAPRISPDGKSVAFIDHPLSGDDQGRIAVIDGSGKKRDLTQEWPSTQGLAWGPNGKEIWFSASDTGTNSALYAVTLVGKQRLMLRPPGRVMLHDISRDGQLLITATAGRRSVSALGRGQDKERDFTFLDWTRNVALSDDGASLLFEEQGEGGGPHYSVYVRDMDGSPPTRLGEGNALSFSPDGKWVLTANISDPQQLFAVPVGAGEERQLTNDVISHTNGGFWLPDGRIVFNALETGHPLRAYVMDANGGGSPRALAPEGVAAHGVSPNGRTVLLFDTQGKLFLAPVTGGELRPVPQTSDLDRFAGWASDVNYVYMYRASDIPARIYELNLTTGAQRQVRQFMPSDPAGLINIGPIQVTPDGRHYAYGYVRVLADLYVVDGLK